MGKTLLKEKRLFFYLFGYSNFTQNILHYPGNREYAFSNLAALIQHSAIFAIGYLISIYLQYVKGLKPLAAGAYLLVQPAVMALLSPYAGRLSDRIRPGVIASAGMGLTSVGLSMLVFIGPATEYFSIVVSLFLMGAGIAFFSSPNTNAVMGAVDKKLLGVASGTLGTMRIIGQMTGMAITLLLFESFMGQAVIAEANRHLLMSVLRWAFIIFTGLCIASVFASLARNRRDG